MAATGTIRSRERSTEGMRLWVESPLATELQRGDSVAVNGICLTATDARDGGFGAEVMAETLRRSSLGPLEEGDAVNLELPLRATDRLDGHIVQGHVDGLARVERLTPDGFATLVRIACPPELMRYVVEKGSIAIDGVSLTVAEVHDDGFGVALIPETLARTTLGRLEPGASVNVEVDVLAKYVEKLVTT